MNSTHKLLPTELVAFVHHVELNRDGWWDKAMHRLVLVSVWLASDLPSPDDIKKTLKSEFGLTVGDAKIESTIAALEKQEFLVRQPGNKFLIPDERRSIFEEEVTAAENSAIAAKKHFCDLVKEIFDDLSPEDVWVKFESVFLAPLIRENGANAYKFIAGEEMTVTRGLVHKFNEEFGPTHREKLFNLVVRFLDPSNESVRSYISRMLHATFCVAASGLPDTVISKLTGSVKKQIRFHLFVDTNFLFSIMSIHDNPSNSSAIELKELIASLKSNLKIDLYVTSRTIEEAQSSISAAQLRLAEFPTGPNFTRAASKMRLSGLDARFFDARAKKSGKLSSEEWFGTYLNNFVSLAESNGVKLFDENLDNYATRQDVIDDILYVQNEEKDRGKQEKAYKVIEHDMILWHLVNDKRPNYMESPVEAKDWIITLDYRLIRFDKQKRENHRGQVPICIHPISLIQLLQFWIPRNKKFEEAILSSMTLPFLFSEVDAEAEDTSLRILKGIGRFEQSDQIPEDAIERVMLDEGLRARLRAEENEEKDAKMIRDSMVEELGGQAKREKQRADESDEIVKHRDSELRALDKKIEGKDREIEKLKKQFATKVATFKYFLVLAFIIAISGLLAWSLPMLGLFQSSINLIGTNWFRVVVSLLGFFVMHLIFEQLVKQKEPMNHLQIFQIGIKFRRWLWSVVITAVVGIVVIIIAGNIQNATDEKPQTAPLQIDK